MHYNAYSTQWLKRDNFKCMKSSKLRSVFKTYIAKTFSRYYNPFFKRDTNPNSPVRPNFFVVSVIRFNFMQIPLLLNCRKFLSLPMHGAKLKRDMKIPLVINK